MMKIIWMVTLIGAVGLVQASPVVDDPSLTELYYRDPRLFFLYITLPADRCKTGLHWPAYGNCYTHKDCTRMGGSHSGTCHNNLGVCCYFVKKCGTTIKRRHAVFVNPAHHATENSPISCTSVVGLIKNTCQLKLDFQSFELAPADSKGECTTDSLEVVGSTTPNTPKFCGTKTGQTVYLNVDPLKANPLLKVVLGTSTVLRKWSINVTQITCNSPDIGSTTFPVPGTPGGTPSPSNDSSCVSTSPINPKGVCYSATECSSAKGIAAGICPQNKVCCTFIAKCGETIERNHTSFTNVDYPVAQTSATTCTSTVDLHGTDICQLKLDLKAFHLQDEDANGVCSTDSLEIIGSSDPTIPKLCGTRNGETIYVNVSSSAPDPKLKMTVGSGPEERKWNINVTQIFCNSTQKGKTVFPVKHVPCDTTSTINPKGTCHAAADCSANGGRAAGTCPGDQGVCCFFTQQCGDTIKTNNTNMVNDGYPGLDGNNDKDTTCTTKIKLLDPNVCQIRLDFTEFDLAQPSSEGVCEDDYMEITGTTSSKIPKLCGLNTGQHLYLNVIEGSEPEVKFTLKEGKLYRKWNINVTQIYCNSTEKAPAGCLQYHTEAMGTVKSFNHKTPVKDDLENNENLNVHLADLDYSICVKTVATNCKISWSASDIYGFIMGGDVTAVAADIGLETELIEPADALECKDYIGITGGTFTAGGIPKSSERYCGHFLPTVTSTNQPFQLRVLTEGTEDTDDKGNTGFDLTYAQTNEGC